MANLGRLVGWEGPGWPIVSSWSACADPLERSVGLKGGPISGCFSGPHACARTRIANLVGLLLGWISPRYHYCLFVAHLGRVFFWDY